MDFSGFKKFLETDTGKKDAVISGIPDMAVQVLGIPPEHVNQAMLGMFPTVNSQMIMPLNKKTNLQMSVLPTDYKISPDGKKGKMKLLTQLSPFVFANDTNLAKVFNTRNLSIDLPTNQIDKMVFQGMPIGPQI
jgi:hypothetical protein